MSDKIVSFDDAAIKKKLESLVKETIQDTLNALLDEEGDRLVGAERVHEIIGLLVTKPYSQHQIGAPQASEYSSSCITGEIMHRPY